MAKNKFIICSFLSFILVACSIPNPIKKKEIKVTYKECPQSLILYKARSIDFGNTNIELQNDYNLSCYLFADEDSVEISTDYKLNIYLSDEDKNTYEVELIVFVTDESKQITIDEFKYLKELKIENNDRKFFVFKFNDKIQIDLNTYNSGVRLFFAIN